MIEEYLNIVGDPAHLGAELTFLLAEVLLVKMLFKWLINIHHKKHHPELFLEDDVSNDKHSESL